MNCDFKLKEKLDGIYLYECTQCGVIKKSKYENAIIQRKCEHPKEGPISIVTAEQKKKLAEEIYKGVDWDAPVEEKRSKKAEGLGDTVANTLDMMGLTKERYATIKNIVMGKGVNAKKDCTPCAKRQQSLNKLFPYKNKEQRCEGEDCGKSPKQLKQEKKEQVKKERAEQENPEPPII